MVADPTPTHTYPDKVEKLFDLEHLFFALNVNQTHWTVAHVDLREQMLKYYDSYGIKRGKPELRGIHSFLRDWHQMERQEPMGKFQCFLCSANTPQQDNGEFLY